MKKLILIFTLGFSLAFAEPNYSFYLTFRDEMSHKTENGFTAVNKKCFELADLNFGGYTMILDTE